MKIYELTSNGLDGYTKYLVRGIKNDREAKELAKKVFRNAYSPSLISYYADVGKSYGRVGKIPSMSIKQFLKYKKGFKVYD